MSNRDPIPPDGRFRVRVLGCRVNQAEARKIEESLENAGLRGAGPGEEPDLVLLHSCAVTAEAEAQSAQQLRRLRARYPDARLVWSGCGAGRHAGKGIANFLIEPGPNWETRWTEVLDALTRPGLRSMGSDSMSGPRAGRVRAFLKVQDGCDLSCAYCLVPSLRGPSREIPPENVLREARALVASGCPELVVTGVSVGLYGRDRAGLATLLTQLTELPGLERVRLSSLHPAEVNAELLAVWRERQERIQPHLHLPLQSGSDRVLAAMRRGYDVRGFLGAVDRARSALDAPSFTTDLIAGFPGETGEDHRDSVRLCEEIGFARMHVFPFSPRPGTEAAGLPDPVPVSLARARARELRELSDRLSLRTHQELVGQSVQVLAESLDSQTNLLYGYTERYFPVRFPGPGGWIGSLQSVRITSASAHELQGLRPGGDLRSDAPDPARVPSGASS